MYLRTVLGFGALASLALGQGLHNLAKGARKLYFGTATKYPGADEASDQFYMNELNKPGQFGQLTHTYLMKFSPTEPLQGQFQYGEPDKMMKLAKANDQIVRCHALVWHVDNPGWLTNRQWGRDELIGVLQNHIDNVVKHWGSDCYAWDVVNEAFNDDGSLRSTIWKDSIGDDYIEIAFRAARDAAPAQVKLYYNDYGIERPNPKTAATLALARDLKEKGLLDGIGFQAHFTMGDTPSEQEQMDNLAQFTALDVDVAYTELDIRTDMPIEDAEKPLHTREYRDSVAACVRTPRCVGVTLWDFVDSYSWVPEVFPGQGYGTPWVQTGGQNTKLLAKEAYGGLIEGLSGTGLRSGRRRARFL